MTKVCQYCSGSFNAELDSEEFCSHECSSSYDEENWWSSANEWFYKEEESGGDNDDLNGEPVLV